MEIALIILFFIALLLYIVWLPFFKSKSRSKDKNSKSTQASPKKNIRDETNVELYKEHKAEIEKDLALQKIREQYKGPS